ncbi:MAG: hypothetical protein VZR95_09005, partial [Alphaproteobacteria bacterium]
KKEEETPPAVEQNDEFADLENQKEIYGRVYRITSPVDSVGRPSSEFVGKVTERVFEDYIGPIFGPGRYKIHYRVTRSDGSKFERDEYFNIGKEFAKKEPAAPVQAPAPSLDLGGLLGGLTVEKITAIGAGLKLIKDFLAPPPPPPAVDVAKLLEIFAANNRPQPVSDALLIQAMQSLQKTNTAPSLIQQMRELKEAKEILTDEIGADGNDGEGGQMSFLIEQGLKLLPSLLTATNNNFQAAGVQARENPMVAGLIRNNPDLAQEFIKRAALTYGRENAENLARGFGLQLTPVQPQEQQENTQADDLEREAV